VILNKNKHMLKQNHHQPVLLQEVLRYLDPQPQDAYLDLTAGYGGHASEVIQRTKAPELATLIDRDAKSVEELKGKFGAVTEVIHDDFYTAALELHDRGQKYDCILADLGVSSPHLDNASRGFSLRADGPLDMRMDQSQEFSAADIVNGSSIDDLTDILQRYGEEPKARRIARAIVDHRPIETTLELAEIVANQWPGHSRVHPATRTFQALRIAVNDELALLQMALPLWLELLKPGGRLVVISFHSLEDRIVKQFLADKGGERYDAELKILTKTPVTASNTENVSNPRARSAKLRAAAKPK
jgi:16S rRNA (cytosine1402-N4)-methyltransferase